MENLNSLMSASGSPAMKVELIVKIQEQVLKWAPAMKVLEEGLIDDLLAFAMDVHQDVKKTVVGFIEEVCKQRIRMLPKIINTLILLLREDSAMVIKRVIQACGTIYKNTLQWLCSAEDPPEDMLNCWNQLCFIKAQILELIDHENDGIRTNAIKFLEGVIIIQSYSDVDSMKRENDFSLDNVPKESTVLDQKKLEEEGRNIFEVLLKFHGAQHISSVNLIACTGTLCSIAKLRPTYMGQVVEALKNLNSNLPPTLTSSQVSSVRKNLKMQFINLLKLLASFEFRSVIIPILSDLGASQNEINRALPKMDKKEVQLRTKRALENETARTAAKKARLELDEKRKILQKLTESKEMEIDMDEVREQQKRSTIKNEKFIAEALRSVELASYLVISTMARLPDHCPDSFLKNYQPSGSLSIPKQIEKIATALAPQLTEQRLGPGSDELTASPPMKVKPSKSADGLETVVEPVEFQKDETARKLRETLERMKGEQPKLKQRVKTLKLQEISKPLSRDLKQQFLHDAVKRILKCERQAAISGMGFKRKKIISVFASTFMPSVRAIIMDYLMEDIVKRIDLAFMWIFEEYSLLQGFSRYTYVKTEHKHDYAYNLLINELVTKVLTRGPDFRERESLIKRIYLEAPLITDESLKILIDMADVEGLSDASLVLVKDLLTRRPPKEDLLLATLLKFTVHGKAEIREKAIDNILNIYTLHKIMIEEIETLGVKWISYLEKPEPPNEMIKLLNLEGRDDFEDVSSWNENNVKLCVNLLLHLIPHNEKLIHNLVDVYIATPSDSKRIILRVIEAPLKKLGMESKELMKVVDNCAKGSETLVTRIIYVLTETSSPSQEIVDKVKTLYHTKLGDVRILIPIVLHLSKKEIIAALPKFMKLNPQLMKDVFMRLLGLKTDREVPVTSRSTSQAASEFSSHFSKVFFNNRSKFQSLQRNYSWLYTPLTHLRLSSNSSSKQHRFV